MDKYKCFDQAERPERKRRGERREAIITAAMEILREHGYEGISLNAIIERVGGSKRDFYTQFGGKEGLVMALLEDRIARQLKEQEAAGAPEKDLRSTLLGIARNVIASSVDPEIISIYRFMAQGGKRFPQILAKFYEEASLKGEEYIAAILEDAAARGDALLPCSAALAASCFMGMLHGKLFIESLLNVRDAVTREEIEAYVVSIVDLFMNGIGPGKSAGNM